MKPGCQWQPSDYHQEGSHPRTSNAKETNQEMKERSVLDAFSPEPYTELCLHCSVIRLTSPLLEKAMAPHSSTLAWKIRWTEERGRLQSMGSLESDTTERLHFHIDFSLSCIGEGNGNPLQCSCLENPRDGGAWWAVIYGVPKSWTQLSDLTVARTMGRPSFSQL